MPILLKVFTKTKIWDEFGRIKLKHSDIWNHHTHVQSILVYSHRHHIDPYRFVVVLVPFLFDQKVDFEEENELVLGHEVGQPLVQHHVLELGSSPTR